jgi:hypothetical protein
MAYEYVSKEDYQKSQHLTDAEMPKNIDLVLLRASDLLDDLTRDYYRVHSIDDDRFPLRVTRFKRAVILQAAYLAGQGAMSTEELNAQPVTQTIGRTTVSRAARNSSGGDEKSTIYSEDAIAALSGTGLLYRGVDHAPY